MLNYPFDNQYKPVLERAIEQFNWNKGVGNKINAKVVNQDDFVTLEVEQIDQTRSMELGIHIGKLMITQREGHDNIHEATDKANTGTPRVAAVGKENSSNT